MQFDEFYDRFILDDSIVQKIGFNPYYQSLQSGLDETLLVDGKEYIDLATNNYLGLANHSELKNAAIQAIKKYGVSLCATPIAAGNCDLYERTTSKLANFIGLDDSIIYPSCYQANNGLFAAVVGKEDVVITDQFAHSSLIEGIRAVGCKLRPFLHNNLANLEKNLINCTKYRQIFVVTESVFSTDGSIAPLKEINDICVKYKAIPVVDDSHGIGVLGKNGKGILEHEHLASFNGIYTTSLGKAIGNVGGLIAGKKTLIEYLRYYSSHLVYSTVIPPHILAGILAAVDLIEVEFTNRSKILWSHYTEMRNAVRGIKYNISNSQAPILSIHTGHNTSTFTFAKNLFNQGIIATPFIYPSVSKNKGIVRLIAGANISTKSINRVCKALKTLT